MQPFFRITVLLAICFFRTDPKDASAALLIGKQALDARDAEQAIVHFSETIRIDPRNATAFFLRAEAHDYLVQSAQAISDLTSAIGIQPKYAEAYRQGGRLYYFDRAVPKALADLNAAIEFSPKDPVALIYCAHVFYEYGQYDKCAADFKAAYSINAHDRRVKYQLAKFYATCPDAKFRNGRKAVTLAKEVTKDVRWSAELALLAAAYAEVGDFKNAVHYQRKAVELPDSPNVKKMHEEQLRLYQEGKPLRIKRNLLDR